MKPNRKAAPISKTGAKNPVDQVTRAMPSDVGGTMPSNTMFPRLQAFADNLSPNPAEPVARRNFTGPGRMVGNFSDRKTPHDIMNLWKPTGDAAGTPAKKV